MLESKCLKRILQVGLVALCVFGFTNMVLGNEKINQCIKTSKAKEAKKKAADEASDAAWKNTKEYKAMRAAWDARKAAMEANDNTKEYKAMWAAREAKWIATKEYIAAWQAVEEAALQAMKNTKEYKAWEVADEKADKLSVDKLQYKDTKEYRAWQVAREVADKAEWRKTEREYNAWVTAEEAAEKAMENTKEGQALESMMKSVEVAWKNTKEYKAKEAALQAEEEAQRGLLNIPLYEVEKFKNNIYLFIITKEYKEYEAAKKAWKVASSVASEVKGAMEKNAILDFTKEYQALESMREAYEELVYKNYCELIN